VRVVVYPINGDGSAVSAAYVSQLRDATFEPIGAFFKEEGRRHVLRLAEPVDVRVGPLVASQPPATPYGGNRLAVILWSLRLRYWAYWNDGYTGPKPNVRIFVSYFDPVSRPRLSHSTGLQKGLIGVVNAFARADMDGSNNVVITHEMLHTFGATDKYDTANNHPLFPIGYADPRADPLYPQTHAEIMAGRIPLTPAVSETPAGMDEVVIGAKTAQEINWTK